MGFLHRRELVHRDIKLSNIVIVNGEPKLADLGLVSSAHNATSFLGTEGYFPREGSGTKSADVYALGKVLYELWTGLDRTEFPELPQIIRSKDGSDWWTQDLNAIILKACDTRVSARYVDADALHTDLSGLKGPRRRDRIPSRRQRLLGAAVSVLIISLFLMEALSRRSSPRLTDKNRGILAGPIISPVNGHRYYLLENSTWFFAEARAKALGGHLVTIRNQREQDWIYNTFSQFGGVARYLWIGLYDTDLQHNASNNISRRTEFAWISGDPVTYSNWGRFEPSGQLNGTNLTDFEAYVQMFSPAFTSAFPGLGGQWNDAGPTSLGSAGPMGVQYSPANGVVEVLPPQELKGRQR